MDLSYALGAASAENLIAPGEVAATAAQAAVDISPYEGTARALLTASNTAGTTPTLAVKLQTAPDPDLIGTVGYTGTGNGAILDVHAGADAVTETITITLSSATAFAVLGSVSGSLGSGTVGTKFESAKISFLIVAGSTAFVNTDAFTVAVTGRTWTDLVSFTGLTTLASVQSYVIPSIGKLDRYLRAYCTIGGTDSPAYRVALTLLAMSR